MKKEIITYEGVSLYSDGAVYASLINDKWLRFKSAADWKKCVDKEVKKI